MLRPRLGSIIWVYRVISIFISFNLLWSNPIQSHVISTNPHRSLMILWHPILSPLILYHIINLIKSNLINLEQIWSDAIHLISYFLNKFDLIQSEPTWSYTIMFVLICSHLIWPDGTQYDLIWCDCILSDIILSQLLMPSYLS